MLLTLTERLNSATSPQQLLDFIGELSIQAEGKLTLLYSREIGQGIRDDSSRTIWNYAGDDYVTKWGREAW